MGFTFPTIQLHPQYQQLLKLLGSSEDTAFLDLGCGLAQNLRQLILDGAQPEQLTGADLNKGLVQCGYDYFRDESRLKSPFIIGDVFNADGDIGQSAQGKFDIIWAAMFYHLWDWDGQLEAFIATTKLLKPKPGSMLVGWQIGASPAREFDREVAVTGQKDVKHRVMYQHDAKSMKKMWEKISEETGVKWKVDVTNDLPEWMARVAIYFGNEGVSRMTFMVTRED